MPVIVVFRLNFLSTCVTSTSRLLNLVTCTLYLVSLLRFVILLCTCLFFRVRKGQQCNWIFPNLKLIAVTTWKSGTICLDNQAPGTGFQVGHTFPTFFFFFLLSSYLFFKKALHSTLSTFFSMTLLFVSHC